METEEIDEQPIPVPDLDVITEMQAGILDRLENIQNEKEEGKPVIWCSVLSPTEILHSMDAAVLFSDVLGGYASIFGLSGKYCQMAEEGGLPRDVCAIHRCAVGLACCDERNDFFDDAFTVPDIAIGSNFPCMSMSKSFLYVVNKYKIPYYFIDAPINTWGSSLPDHAVEYYAGQFQGMIDFLEKHGYTFNRGKLEEEVAFTKALNEILDEVDVYKKAVPLPIKAFDNVIATTAPLALSKKTRTLEIFERYRDELKERVEKGIGVIEDEKLRLLWMGLPPLCDFKLLNYPEKHGAVVVKSMLEYLTGFTLDPDLMIPEKPLESLARAQLLSPANPVTQSAVDYFVKAAREYRIDGLISVVKRSCGLLPGIMRLTKEAIQKETGAPSILFDLDGIDEREYDAAATKAHLDSFIETLLEGGRRENS